MIEQQNKTAEQDGKTGWQNRMAEQIEQDVRSQWPAYQGCMAPWLHLRLLMVKHACAQVSRPCANAFVFTGIQADCTTLLPVFSSAAQVLYFNSNKCIMAEIQTSSCSTCTMLWPRNNMCRGRLLAAK